MDQVGRYRILGELGSGAMGVVLEAHDPQHDRRVAIKLLRRGAAADDLQQRRFLRECRALAKLDHPNLLRVVDAGGHEGQLFLVTELLEGDPLEEVLRRHGPLDVDRAVELGLGLARALQAVHAAGLVHRDIKPGNVLLRANSEPVLGDFGLAKDLGRLDHTAELTVTGALLGTPGFWAPEQASGKGSEVGPPSDIYSVGATIYAALTGRPPVEGATLFEIQIATREARPRSIREDRADVPPALEEVVLRCLEKAPGNRYASAAELEKDLQRAESHLNAAPRRRWLPAAVGGVVFAGLLGAIGAWIGASDSTPTRDDPSADAIPATSAGSQAESLFAEAEAERGRKDYAAAVALYREAADKGHAGAMRRLGQLATIGRGVPKDLLEALRWLERSADAGSEVAMLDLASILMSPKGAVPQDLKRGVSWLGKAAEAGHLPSKLHYGQALCDGVGIAPDPQEGARWVRLAAEEGYVPAMCTLGFLHKKGQGVERDVRAAARWYRKAVDGGNVPALSNLGVMLAEGIGVARDEEEAVLLFRRGAKQDDAICMSYLAQMLVKGRGAVQDEHEALRLYRIAAERDNGQAMVGLGALLMAAEKIPRDEAEGMRWLRAAAEKKNVDGMVRLGSFLMMRGDPASVREAASWFGRAAERGDAGAMHNYAVMLSAGQGVEKDEADAVRWYHRAAAAGNADSAFNLGSLYFRGQGVPTDRTRSRRYYQQAYDTATNPKIRRAAKRSLADLDRRDREGR
jgi:TPR repeat protein